MDISKKMKEFKAAVIIINWNGIRLLGECLDSVENQDYGNFKIIFVDNGSTDGSIEFVKSKYPNVEIIALDRNTGFAKANNIGIKKALEDNGVQFVALLNNDAIADRRWLSEMVQTSGLADGIGLVAVKIMKYYKKNIIDSIGNSFLMDGGGTGNFMNECDDGQYMDTWEIFGPSGCSSLYTRGMLEDIEMNGDYFDSDFFAYFEDIDLNWRAKLRGWKCYFAHKAIVYHKHSETTGLYSPFKAFYTNRNRYFVVIKNFPATLLPEALLSLFSGYFYSILSLRGNKGPSARFIEKSGFGEAVKIIARGWLDIMVSMPKMIKKRIYIQRRKIVSVKDIKEWMVKYKLDYKKVLFNEHIK